MGVMAWTTHAAILIAGKTFHKFLSIGIAELPKESILDHVRRSPFVRSKVSQTKFIFIEELPQFPTRWLVVLEYVVRQLSPAYKQATPWGGVQGFGT